MEIPSVCWGYFYECHMHHPTLYEAFKRLLAALLIIAAVAYINLPRWLFFQKSHPVHSVGLFLFGLKWVSFHYEVECCNRSVRENFAWDLAPALEDAASFTGTEVYGAYLKSARSILLSGCLRSRAKGRFGFSESKSWAIYLAVKDELQYQKIRMQFILPWGSILEAHFSGSVDLEQILN